MGRLMGSFVRHCAVKSRIFGLKCRVSVSLGSSGTGSLEILKITWIGCTSHQGGTRIAISNTVIPRLQMSTLAS